MPYYTRTYDPQPTTRVASTDLKDEFQTIESALGAVETDVGKGIRAPEAITALPNAASRANKVLSFDASGHPAVPIAVADLAAAVTAASNAATSATAAAASATSASGSASTATTQASNASTSATAAASSASAASTSATNAATSASTAATQASNASTSATNAASSASAAATSATNAANSATTAGTHATNAGNSATAASASASDAAASFDAFDDRYLGSKTSNPTLDNDGNALLTGALYWNSTANEMRAWSGSAWVAAYLPASGYATLTGTETLTNKTINIANNTLTGVQATLVSGTNIKTVGGVSLLGSGDVPIPAAGLTLIATLTPANGVTTVTATGLTSSKSLLIVPDGIAVAANSGLNFAVSANGGGSFGTNFTFTATNSTTPSGFAQVFRTNESSSAKPYYVVNAVSPGSGRESSITGVIDAVRISLTAATTFTGTGSIYIYGLN